jgi:hypothetical protein
VPQSCYFSIQNALKLTYKHLQVKKFFRGLRPRTPRIRGAKGGEEGREGKREKEKGKGMERGGREGRREGKGPREGGKGENWGYSPQVSNPVHAPEWRKLRVRLNCSKVGSV